MQSQSKSFPICFEFFISSKRFHQVVVEEVTGGSSSVLGGVDELQLNVEVEGDNFNGFATSRLVVQDSILATSEDLRSPSVELVSPSVETVTPPSELACGPGLQSPGSSVGLVSLESSVCLASPSPSLEVLTPPQEGNPAGSILDGMDRVQVQGQTTQPSTRTGRRTMTRWKTERRSEDLTRQ